ncbi:MAG TPA: glycosyltransferase [Streptosporangiaceae bacterium]|jgi:hypothetical protein|nr:glycosyltransferase [Streptosporangiaceae bacterium]
MSSRQCLYGPWAPGNPHAPRAEIVVPVRNEEHDLAESIRRLVTHLRTSFPFTAQVTIADNGSTDRTWPVATDLERMFREVPVDWIDDTDSRAGIVATALGDLRGIVRVGQGLGRGTIRVPRCALTALHAVSARPGRVAEVTVLVLANLVATGLTAAGAGFTQIESTQTRPAQTGPAQAAPIHPEGTE